jgi:hypothetical protein
VTLLNLKKKSLSFFGLNKKRSLARSVFLRSTYTCDTHLFSIFLLFTSSKFTEYETSASPPQNMP